MNYIQQLATVAILFGLLLQAVSILYDIRAELRKLNNGGK